MSTACATCGAERGAARRYCLRCGVLLGERSIPIAEVEALGRDGPRASTPTIGPTPAGGPRPRAAGAATPVPPWSAPAAPRGGDTHPWRRPATSALAAVALAAGVAIGYLAEPRGGAAEAATVAQAPVGATTTDEGAVPAPDGAATGTAPAAATAGPTAGAAAPTATSTATPATTGPAAVVAGPSPADAAPAAATAPVTTPTPASGGTATSGSGSRRTTTPAKEDPEPEAPATASTGLPKIEHVWVVAVGSQVTGRDTGYVAESLLPRGTELSRYAARATDPLAGAADLISGGAPSSTAATIADQLSAGKQAWRVYTPGPTTCSGPADLNPFLAFPTLLGTSDCASRFAPLSALPADLAEAPAFSYVALDPTLDAAAVDAQLRQVVEPIRRSAAFRRAGLIAVVPTTTAPSAPGGALLLSPFVAHSTSVATPTSPFALLRTVQDLLGLDHLGGAGGNGVRALGRDVFPPAD